MDVAGTVEAVGEGVTAFAPGDEVYGCAGGVRGMSGALAEYLLTDPALLAPKPPQLSWREAAALPLVTITAWEGLFDRAHLAAGQTVLVFAGTGGVGHIAVQLAKAAGATVVATASDPKKADARPLARGGRRGGSPAQRACRLGRRAHRAARGSTSSSTRSATPIWNVPSPLPG